MTSGTHALILAQSAFEAVCKERDEIKTQADNLAKEFEASKAYAERCKQGGMSAIQPTPETDEAWAKWPYAGPGVHANFARKLERERDSAKTLNRTLLDQLEAKDAQIEALREEREQWRMSSVCREKDAQLEAMREAIKEAAHTMGNLIIAKRGGMQPANALIDATLHAKATLAKLQPFLKP